MGSIALIGCGTVRGGYETARFTEVRNAGQIAIRQYDDLVLIGTSTAAPRTQSEDSAFMRLFGYISGGNDAEQKIAMTTPVFSTNDKSGDAMEMFFVVPAEVQAAAPEPTGKNVRLVKQPGMTVAVVRFSGRMSAAIFDHRKS
ncbi:MAG: hypothetical protein ACI8W8_001219 [Rhodothermales bacterium]|jgi:hypothetical protein